MLVLTRRVVGVRVIVRRIRGIAVERRGGKRVCQYIFGEVIVMRKKIDRKLKTSWTDAPNVDLVARTF
jgi:hypothetical protein